MAVPRSTFASFAILLLAASACQAQQVVRLGFLLPYPDGDTAVPQRLADEWISTVRVALEVLGPKYENNFVVEPFVQNSGCDAEVAKQAAQRLVYTNVVGVVGPACSEAVMGANSVLKPAGIPFISFAGTADGFSSDVDYPTFFRTVFPDSDQAVAIKSVVDHFNFDMIHLFYSDELYGSSLALNLKNLLGTERLLQPIKVPYPMSTDPTELDRYFANLRPSNASICIFAVLPRVAEGLWKAALRLNKTAFPWWYLGTDGAVAFDLVGEGENLANLTRAIQGEIGVGPYKGNYNPHSSPFMEFIDFWRAKTHEEYPGLLTLDVSPRFSEARAYVSNLIDSIWAFFEAFNNIIVEQGKEVTSDLVLQCFRGTPTECIAFNGASGTVKFNATTGERSTDASSPQYGFYNLIDVTWKEKSKWVLNSYDINPTLEYIMRPGPLPLNWRQTLKNQMQAPPAIIPEGADANPPPLSDTYDQMPKAPETNYDTSGGKAPSSGGGGPSTGAIVALVLVLLVAVGVLGYGGYWWYNRHYVQPEQQQFVRML